MESLPVFLKISLAEMIRSDNLFHLLINQLWIEVSYISLQLYIFKSSLFDTETVEFKLLVYLLPKKCSPNYMTI